MMDRAEPTIWKDRVRDRRGMTLIELLVGMVVFSIIVAGTARMLAGGQAQQRLARNYSDIQTDLRTALSRATLGIRHGKGVVMGSTQPSFPTEARNSTTTQLIVSVPQPTSPVLSDPLEIRYYFSNGVFYRQANAESAPGTALITGVQSLYFSYFQTTAAGRTAVDSAPASATEVQIRVIVSREQTTVESDAWIALRNKISGL